MGRKNVIKSFKLIDSEDLATSFTTQNVNVINLDKASIHLSWTGTSPIGAFTVEARNGEDDDWFELTLGGGTIDISGDSGDHQLNFFELPFTDIRLIYTATSGIGTIEGFLSAKVTGA